MSGMGVCFKGTIQRLFNLNTLDSEIMISEQSNWSVVLFKQKYMDITHMPVGWYPGVSSLEPLYKDTRKLRTPP